MYATAPAQMPEKKISEAPPVDLPAGRFSRILASEFRSIDIDWVRTSLRQTLANARIEPKVEAALLSIMNQQRPPETIAIAEAIVSAFKSAPAEASTLESQGGMSTLRQFELLGTVTFALALVDHDWLLGELLAASRSGETELAPSELEERLRNFAKQKIFPKETFGQLLQKESANSNSVSETAILRGMLRPIFVLSDNFMQRGWQARAREKRFAPPAAFADLREPKPTSRDCSFLEDLLEGINVRHQPPVSERLDWIFSHLRGKEQVSELADTLEDATTISEDDYYRIIEQMNRGVDWGHSNGFPAIMDDMRKRRCGDWTSTTFQPFDHYIIWLSLLKLPSVSDPARLRESLERVYGILEQSHNFEKNYKLEFRKDLKKFYWYMIEQLIESPDEVSSG